MGVYISNHYFDIELANGKSASVEVNSFNRDKITTEPMPCTISTDEE